MATVSPFHTAAAALCTHKAAIIALKRKRAAVHLAERCHGLALAARLRAEAAVGVATATASLLPTWMQCTAARVRAEADWEAANAALRTRTEELQRARCVAAAAEAAAVAAKRALQAANDACMVPAVMARFDDTETGQDVAMLQVMCALRRARRVRQRTEAAAHEAAPEAAHEAAPRPYWTPKVSEVAASSFVPTREAMEQVSRTESPFCFRETWFSVRQFRGRGPLEPVIFAQAVAAIDPGVRTFLTVYSPTLREVYEVGLPCDRDMLRHAAAKGLHVLHEFVSSLHRVMVKWLVHNFRTIYVPALGGEEQSRRCRLRLGAHVAQDLDAWGHAEFLQQLQAAASASEETCTVHVVDEAYTTRTCTLCGVVAPYIGGATVFSCAACGLQLPRDWNGARGIWLRSFSKTYTP
jgi:hypothetical protein